MATVYFSLSTMANREKKQIMIRFSHGRVNQRAKSGVFVNPAHWDNIAQSVIMPKSRLMTDAVIATITELREVDSKIRGLRDHIIDTYTRNPDAPSLDKEWLKLTVYSYDHVEEQPQVCDYWGAWDLFIGTQVVSHQRTKMYKVVRGLLQRFEVIKKVQDKKFALELDTFTSLLLSEFEVFMRTEEKYAEKYPKIYKDVPLSHIQRGANTIASRLSVLRAFCNWAINKELTTNNPFTKYSIKPAVYGTPIYISKEERDQLYASPMPTMSLEIVRDMFVLQCFIGCRVGDYFKMTKNNIVDGAIEYIAGKTADERPLTVRVPLTSKAKDIIAKYPDTKDNMLMPFISRQKYSDYIKECFKHAGITRLVTILDSLTGEPKQVPICDIASSHMARRAFVGNLYKQVQDPNLIGSLSGHREGSKAFARYRDIDDDLKRKTVSLLE